MPKKPRKTKEHPLSHAEIMAFEAYNLPLPIKEHVFARPRRWRFDYAWIDQKVALEREGGTWQTSRHNRGTGYRNDCQKYNRGQILGWIIIRATVDMMDSGEAYVCAGEALEARRK